MLQLGNDQTGHREFDRLRGPGQREEELAPRHATRGPAEHRAAADLFPAEHPKQLAEPGQGSVEGVFDDADGLFISVLADPTTGGVTASFAMLGDFIVAEPKALIGFAGPRTIWNTIKVELPEGFQRSEFLRDKGFVDFVVPRKDLRSELARLVDYCGK